jgi:hypothetical protein
MRKEWLTSDAHPLLCKADHRLGLAERSGQDSLQVGELLLERLYWPGAIRGRRCKQDYLAVRRVWRAI